MISIITVNFNSYDFLYLMIDSLERFSYCAYELIVIDNSEKKELVQLPHVHQFYMPTNVGHGRGLNHGVAKAYEMFPNHSFIMFLDVDCHMISHRWESPLLEMMRDYDLVGGRGVPSKPIRPACMFMKKDLGSYDWADSEGYKGNRKTPGGYDVAIKAYYKIMADNFKIGFLEAKPNRYGTLNGEEWCAKGKPIVYHHWHGSHLKERQEDFQHHNLLEDKAKLFQQIPWRLP
jgi:glycosyltransferase involved in cell wall biosynthesis